MPNGAYTTQIPAPRVPVLDARTGLMSREWYLFFVNLYNLSGSGQNAISLTDVQVGPSDSALTTFQADVDSTFQALESAPSLNSFTADQINLATSIQGLQEAPSNNALLSTIAKLMSDAQALALSLDGNALLSAVTDLSTDFQSLKLAPANTPQIFDGRYGAFSDSTTQTAAATNTAYAVTFNTTDLSNGVYIGSPTSRVYVDRPGVYNFQFSAQLNQSSSSAHDVYIWADINGSSVANSATKVTLVGNNAAAVAAWNFVLNMNANDYFRLMWSTSNTACEISAAAAVAPVPAIPSVILTVTDNIGIKR